MARPSRAQARDLRLLRREWVAHVVRALPGRFARREQLAARALGESLGAHGVERGVRCLQLPAHVDGPILAAQPFAVGQLRACVYDTRTLANDLVGLMDALRHSLFAVAGVDTGIMIGYALAADHPDRVARVALGESPLPGIAPPRSLILPDQLVDSLWHIPFNQLKETNEKLVSGREGIFFGAEFAAAPGRRSSRPTPSGTTSMGCPAARRYKTASSSTAR